MQEATEDLFICLFLFLVFIFYLVIFFVAFFSLCLTCNF